MIRISIIPTVKKYYNSYIFGVDKQLVVFLNKLFKKNYIEVLSSKSNLKTDLLIIAGGNTITKFSKQKEDLIRSKLDNFFFKKALNKKIPILGICHGSQFLANTFGAKLKRDINHGKLRSHNLVVKDKLNKRIYKVNSYHNISIEKCPNALMVIGNTSEGYVEFFKHKRYNLTGIMWHPEREKKIKIFDKKTIKKIIK
tara:strand:- start:74 stop:667 length:594 start_codon:yes stop_codon:yes gene_type:complete